MPRNGLHAAYRLVTAVGRELLGFIWAIGVTVETEPRTKPSIAA